MSGVHEDSVLGLMLFSIFLSYINSGIECTLSKFVNDTKLCGVVYMPKRQDAIQRNLDRLEKWVQENIMRFSRLKCRSCRWVTATPHCKYKLRDERLENSPTEKTLIY